MAPGTPVTAPEATPGSPGPTDTITSPSHGPNDTTNSPGAGADDTTTHNLKTPSINVHSPDAANGNGLKNSSCRSLGPDPDPDPHPQKSSSSRCGRWAVPEAVIVVAASFFINAAYGGLFYVSGLYLHCFLETFNAGKVTTAWVLSLQGSVTYFSGLLSGPLISRFGTRAVAISGSLCSSAAYFLSGFAPNIIFLYATFGILTGIGFGMLMITNGVAVQQHTSQRRALAAGLALTGSGVGAFVMPQLTKWALDTYGWRGSLLLLSGILLNTLPCAMLLRPPPPIPLPEDDLSPFEEEKIAEVENGHAAMKLLIRSRMEGLGSRGEVAKSMSSAAVSTVSIASAPKEGAKTSVGGSVLSIPLVYSSTLSLNRRLRQDLHNGHLMASSVPSMHSAGSSRGVKDLLKDMFSPSDFKSELNLVIVLVIASWFFFFSGMPVVYVFCVEKAMSVGLKPSTGALFISVSGLGELSGRIIGSGLGSIHDRMPLIIYVVNVILSGFSTALVAFGTSYLHLMITMISYGVTMGLATCMCTTVMRDLVGIDKLPWVAGYAFAFGGLGNLFSIQTLALIWERTDTIFLPYIIGGGFLILCGILMLGAQIAKWKDDKKNPGDETG